VIGRFLENKKIEEKESPKGSQGKIQEMLFFNRNNE
jgi:hypothetical protein